MISRRVSAFVILTFALMSARAALTVAEGEDGTLSILRDGRPFVRKIEATGGEPKPKTIERSFETAADGARVWNRWSADKEGRFRLEVVQRPDGAIELSLVGEADGSAKNRLRRLALTADRTAFGGKSWRTMVGNGSRSYCEGGSPDNDFKPREGVFAADLKGFKTRWMETEGVVWDFNCFGPPANRHQQGEVSVTADGDFVIGRDVGFGASWGGWGMTKLILREGRYEDYHKYHFLFTFLYGQRLPATLVSIGAPRAGKDYATGDLAYDETRGFGWVGEPRRRTVVGHASGAYYSQTVGSGKAVYRFKTPVDGYYLMTAQIGNYTGTKNRFALSVNGVPLGGDITVPARKARTLTRAVRIRGGCADFTLDGDWIVSALAVQPLMTDAEDFSVARGFWYVKGYEPSHMFRSEYYEEPCSFALCDETVEMPVPGQETAAKFRPPPRPRELPDPGLPSLRWMRSPRVWEVLGNGSSLGELEDEAFRTAFFDRGAAKGYNAVMMNAMLSRHTFADRQIAYGEEMTAKLAREAHARGMKYIDHPDATLLWNMDIGFKVLMNRPGQLLRSRFDNLPSTHLCPNNPSMKEWLFGYLRRQVEHGVDGFQLDECEFWEHGCTCKWCRERFHEETGWWYPLDETSESVLRISTPLAKRWFEWRYQTIATWFVELRRFVKDIKPDLVLCMYNHHWAFQSSAVGRMQSTDLLEMGRSINYMGTEVLAKNVIQSSRPLLPLRRMFNVLNRLHGAPVFGFYYNPDMTRRYFSSALANMCGQAALLGDTRRDPKMPDFEAWATSSANMVREGAEPIAEIALLFSRYSRDWNVTPGHYVLADLLGLAQELEAMSVPYEFVGDGNVNAAGLAKYKVLMLGTAQCLSDAEIAEIKAFAQRGGKVCLCEGTGTKDEIGESRAVPAFAGELADPASNVVRMPQARDFFCWEIWPPQRHLFNPDPKKQTAFRESVRALVKGATVWKTAHIPDFVYTSLWRERNGDTLVHFLNSTGTNIKYGDVMPDATPEPAFPPLKEDIRFALPARAGVRVTASSPDFAGEVELETRRTGDGLLAVSLPKNLLKAYTIVRIR